MLNLNTGAVKIPIQRDGEAAGSICFNPNELDFAERFYSLLAEFEEKEKEYKNALAKLDENNEIDSYGLPKNAAQRLALLRDIAEYMKGRIDYVFGAGTSAVLFGEAIVLEIFEQFFEGVTPYIEQARVGKIEKYVDAKKPTKTKKVMK